MKKNNMLSRVMRLVLLTCLVSSCLNETAVPIESAFTVEASEDKTAPVTIQLKNESYGADEYEWTFEGGQPGSSTDKNPGKVVFTQAGEHKITLRVRNSVEEKYEEYKRGMEVFIEEDFTDLKYGHETPLYKQGFPNLIYCLEHEPNPFLQS